MKKFLKKCKRGLVVVLSIALIGNSMDLSRLNVRAENQSGIVGDGGSVTGGNAGTETNVDGVPGSLNVGESASGMTGNTGADMNALNGVSVSGSESGSVSDSEVLIFGGEDWMQLPEPGTSVPPMGFYSLEDGVVTLASGNHARWIDRIDLSGDAAVFKTLYTNMEEWADNDGTDDWLITGEQGSYTITTFSGQATAEEGEAMADAVADDVYSVYSRYAQYAWAVADAFDRDHPEVFWLAGATIGYTYSYYSSSGVYNGEVYLKFIDTAKDIDIRAERYRDVNTLKAAISTVNTQADAMVAAVANLDTVEKIKYFNEQLTKINEYNTVISAGGDSSNVSADCWECVSALAGKTGTEGPVCEGYSRAFKVLCDKAGIPCILIDGNAGGPHMWNAVQVDGNWYVADITWDDPVVSGITGAVSGYESEKWLLLGSETIPAGETATFAGSHIMQNSPTGILAFTNGPVLSTSKYVNAVAEVTTSGGVTTQYESVKTALEAAGASAGSTLKLLKNTELNPEEAATTKYSTSGNFALDLNGYTLDLGSYTMVISEGATLTVSDSSASGTSNGTGKITSCVQDAGVIRNDGTLKVLSGTIEATEVAEYTGNYAILNNATLEMSGGLVTTNAWGGIGIYNNMEGQATVTGGIVQGSTHAESESASADGIFNEGDLTITGTSGIYGGGNALAIAHNGGSFKLSGTQVVQGSTTMGDICLGSGMVITVAGALTGSGSYSVYSYDTGLGVFAVPGTDYTISDSDKSKFTSVMGFDVSKNSEGKLVFSHVHSDATFDKVWDSYGGDVATGNYVLGYDVMGAGVVNITGDVKLCLNGHTLDFGGYLNIAAGASLSVCDCSTGESGAIIGGDVSTIINNGTITLDSGKIKNKALGDGTVLYNEAGTATMNGGSLECTGEEAEGIYNGAGASLYLYGGSIQATGAESVGVFSAGDFQMSGAPVIEAAKADLAIDSSVYILLDGALTGEEIYTLDYATDDNGNWGDFATVSQASYLDTAKEKFTSIKEGVEVLVNDTSLRLDYQKGDIPIRITWEDEENIYNTRPDSVLVDVYANAVWARNVYLEETEDWKYTLEDMHLYDADGAIAYTVMLNDGNELYSATEGSSENGFVITASLKHVHELYLSQTTIGEADTQWVEILCEGSDDADCNWSAGDYWVTINEPTYLAYDGTVKTASTVDRITDYTDLATVSDIAYYVKNGSEWTAVTEAVDAGTYKAEVTVTMGSDTLAAWVEFEITQLDGESYVEVVPYDDAYDPFAVNGVAAVRVDILHSEMDATIEYSTDGGSNWSTTVPVMSSVGSLEVMVRVTAPNYTDYTETVTAVMAPFDLSACSVGLEQDSYYYTGQQIKPVVTGITDCLGRELPLTAADYEVTYGDNVSVETGGAVSVEVMNSNYTGTAQSDFGINYYDGAVEVLYNGAEKISGYYNADVVISAEGYTVSKTIDGAYTESVMLSGEGMEVEMSVYFKQEGTGYITPATDVSAKIDKTAPSFEGDTKGIHVGENYWNALATAITYDTYFKEAQYGFINVSDLGSGIDIEDIYYYIDKSGSAIAKTAEELDACNFVSVADNVQDDDLNAGTGGDFYIDEDGKYVVYAYVVDRAGNKSVYICSGGIVLDTKVPAVEASVPSEAEGTLTDTDMTFAVEADEDAIAVLEIQSVTDATVGGIIVDSEMTENGFAYLEGLASDTQIEAGSSEGAKYFYKVELSPGEEKEFTLSEMSPNETYMYVIWVFDKAHNLKVIGEELSEEEIRTISVTTLKTIPTFDAEPVITGTYGQKLSEMTVSQPVSTNGATGTWSIVYAGAGQMYDMPAVNGTTAYTVKFTPEDTDTYETVTVQVVPTVGKKELTVTVDNQTKKYGEENPELTYAITEGNIVDANYAGRPTLTIEVSTTATKTSDAGTYDITGTVTNDVNYDVTVKKGTLTITQADAEITVEAGKEAYSKTFGDDAFALSGISTNSDGKLSYSVANRDAVSVDANGKVTINGAGSAVITVSVAATNNYKAAEAVEITVDVAKADTTGVNLSKSYLYLKESQESIDLTAYVPADAGAVTYQVGAVSGECEFTVAPTVTNGKLSYTVKAGEVGENASFAVTVSSDNYETFVIKVAVTLVDQTPVVEREGSEVSLKNNTLTYGEALSKLAFNEAVFVAEGTGEVVTGTLAWETPELTPDVASTKATWVFTPDSNEYMEATGEVAIVVKKATQPAFSIVALGELEYFPGGAERTPVETAGGLANGNVTITVPTDNGVIELGSDNWFAILNAGTVTITAVCVDPEGNYERAIATYELTVLPCELTASQITWEAGVTGAEIYNGTAKEPAIWMYMISGPLTEGTDYTVEYVNNTNAYTLTESETGFDADKAPAVVVTGKGNYTGTVKKYFVINKAEAQITVETGKKAYSKTYGDDAFVLSGINKVGDGVLTYAVADSKNAAGQTMAQDKVITMDATGKVTVVGAGTANIVISLAETDNYNAAEDVVIAVTVAQAAYRTEAIEKNYAYNKDNADSIDLTAKVPADAGKVSYQVLSMEGDISFKEPAIVNAAGTLTYTLAKGIKGQSSTVNVLVSSDNYEDYTITVKLGLPYEVLVVLKSGFEVKATGTLTYGDTLSELVFAEAVFVEEGTDNVVTGTLSWVTPDEVPEVADTTAEWVFTPDNKDYATVTGTTAIVVEKAKQPELEFSLASPGVYGQFEGKISLQVSGGAPEAEITLTVPENNGIISDIVQDGNTFELISESAGTVLLTAVAKDIIGNYEDTTATYELTVAPAQMNSEWISWAEGFDGVAVYTGDALIPNVVVQNETETLVQGKDYTVEYDYNEFAYTLKEGDEGFDVTKAPKVVIIGKGNYEGTAILCFVINKAENAPNMPKDTRTVANSVATTGQVSLPADWVWQDGDQALAEGTVTVAIAVYNGSDKGNYVNEAVAVTITRLEAGIPFITKVNGENVENIENGWDPVSEELAAAEEGDIIVVDMNGATVLPGNVIEQIKGKNIIVVLEMDEEVAWSINGKTITTEEVSDVDMKVDLNTANIPVDVINKITGEIYTMQISLAHNGEFGYTAVLSISLNAENAGYYAQLFYYEETAKKLKFICEDIIGAEGFVELPFTHASEYTIVIDDVAYKAPGSGGNSGSTTTTTPTATPAPVLEAETVPTSPKTDDMSEGWVILMAAAFVMAGLGSVYGRRKRNVK